MQYPEDAAQAADYLRQAIPLMVKYGIEPNPRNFSLWYAYVAGRTPGLNAELDAIVEEHQTCPAPLGVDLFRRYIINDEVDFAYHVQRQLGGIISNLTEQSCLMTEGNGQYESFLEAGLENLQQNSDGTDLKALLQALLEQTQRTNEMTRSFRHQIEQANREIGVLREELQSIQKEASLDALTQISNRRAFDKALATQLGAQTRGDTTPLCLLVTDIDHFKAFNDKYGHVTGDKILQSFARILQHVTPDRGLCARYGGEEFAIILPGHSLGNAIELAECIRITTEKMKIKQRNSAEPVDQITTSLGIAQYRQGESAADFIERADILLYEAKSAGRNRVVAQSRENEPATAPA